MAVSQKKVQQTAVISGSPTRTARAMTCGGGGRLRVREKGGQAWDAGRELLLRCVLHTGGLLLFGSFLGELGVGGPQNMEGKRRGEQRLSGLVPNNQHSFLNFSTVILQVALPFLLLHPAPPGHL